jgi:Tfp pilus assembly protein PilV
MRLRQRQEAEGGFTLIELLFATLLLSLVILPVLANVSVSLERLEQRQKSFLVAHSLALDCLSRPWSGREHPAFRDTTMADGSLYRTVEDQSLVEREECRRICILIRQEGRWDTLWTITERQVPASSTALR